MTEHDAACSRDFVTRGSGTGTTHSDGSPVRFSVLAVCGVTHVRHVDATIAGCLAWAVPLREQGWQIGEPEPWTLSINNNRSEEAA